MSPELTARLQTVLLHNSKDGADALFTELAGRINQLMAERNKEFSLAEAAGEFVDAYTELKESGLVEKAQIDFLNPEHFFQSQDPEQCFINTSPGLPAFDVSAFTPIYTV